MPTSEMPCTRTYSATDARSCCKQERYDLGREVQQGSLRSHYSPPPLTSFIKQEGLHSSEIESMTQTPFRSSTPVQLRTPSILTLEVEAAIKSMKSGAAPTRFQPSFVLESFAARCTRVAHDILPSEWANPRLVG